MLIFNPKLNLNTHESITGFTAQALATGEIATLSLLFVPFCALLLFTNRQKSSSAPPLCSVCLTVCVKPLRKERRQLRPQQHTTAMFCYFSAQDPQRTICAKPQRLGIYYSRTYSSSCIKGHFTYIRRGSQKGSSSSISCELATYFTQPRNNLKGTPVGWPRRVHWK